MAKVILIYLPNCQKCEEMKQCLDTLQIQREELSAGSKEGFELAKKYRTTLFPLPAILIETETEPCFVLHTIDEIKSYFSIHKSV